MRAQDPLPHAANDEAPGAAVPSEDPVIDLNVIADLLELEVASMDPFLTSLVDAFFDDAPRRMVLLEEALASRQARGVQVQAHSLKGSAGALGIIFVVAIAADIEASAQSGDLGKAGNSVPRLRAAIARAETALRDVLARRVLGN